jgi:hypothetical protein
MKTTTRVVKKERKNWFYSYNMIFDQPISEHAKLIYIYLCRCADSEGKSFPSHATIGLKCGIKSRQTVINAIKELEQIGLLCKEVRLNKGGGQTSNLYTIYDSPTGQDDDLCPADGHPLSSQQTPPVQQVDSPCSVDGHEVLPREALPIEGEVPAPNKNSLAQPDPVPTSATDINPNLKPDYGTKTPLDLDWRDKHLNIQLSYDEYNSLVAEYGYIKTAQYIERINNYIEDTGHFRRYTSHYNKIKQWIAEDDARLQAKPGISSPTPTNNHKKPNLFHNFNQRTIDFEEMERREQQYIVDSLRESG